MELTEHDKTILQAVIDGKDIVLELEIDYDWI